jgi:E3 ubiquitin-protein ligase MYCBP2
VQKKLESRWPSARVGFEFRCCPTCKLGMEHPALAAQLAPILELERGIQTKALQRLKYESKDKDTEVTAPGGDYYQKPLEYAMKIYLFFMCFQCKKAYFAGGYQCQEASDAFDPKELICPA